MSFYRSFFMASINTPDPSAKADASTSISSAPSTPKGPETSPPSTGLTVHSPPTRTESRSRSSVSSLASTTLSETPKAETTPKPIKASTNISVWQWLCNVISYLFGRCCGSSAKVHPEIDMKIANQPTARDNAKNDMKAAYAAAGEIPKLMEEAAELAPFEKRGELLAEDISKTYDEHMKTRGPDDNVEVFENDAKRFVGFKRKDGRINDAEPVVGTPGKADLINITHQKDRLEGLIKTESDEAWKVPLQIAASQKMLVPAILTEMTNINVTLAQNKWTDGGKEKALSVQPGAELPPINLEITRDKNGDIEYVTVKTDVTLDLVEKNMDASGEEVIEPNAVTRSLQFRMELDADKKPVIKDFNMS